MSRFRTALRAALSGLLVLLIGGAAFVTGSAASTSPAGFVFDYDAAGHGYDRARSPRSSVEVSSGSIYGYDEARSPVFAAKAGRGADNVANGPRLAADLTRREAAAVFDDAGRLHPDVIANSQLIIRGGKLNNPEVVRELTRDGSNIADWGKYATQRFKSPSGPFEVHFYRNRATGAVNYNIDYKAVLGGRAP